jgi:hypothetical protein
MLPTKPHSRLPNNASEWFNTHALSKKQHLRVQVAH